jgi:hypothetical protein
LDLRAALQPAGEHVERTILLDERDNILDPFIEPLDVVRALALALALAVARRPRVAVRVRVRVGRGLIAVGDSVRPGRYASTKVRLHANQVLHGDVEPNHGTRIPHRPRAHPRYR